MPLSSSTAEKSPPSKPLVIPVFIPNAGCPHRCVFCNQRIVTGQVDELPPAEKVKADIDRFLAHRGQARHPVQIAFYGGNFLGLAPSTIVELLETAGRYVKSGRVDGLRFSTRPDTITPERIELLQAHPVTTVEIGAQSMSEHLLRGSRRGHSPADTVRAVDLLKASGYEIGIQLMVGLPGETRKDVDSTGRMIAALGPDLARVYPTLVLEGSPLSRMYRQGRFTPIDLDEAVRRTTMLYRRFCRSGIRVIRMGLQATDDLSPSSNVLAGPYHPAFGQLVLSALLLEAMTAAIEHRGLQGGLLELKVNPRSESKLRGLRNRNLDFLRGRYGLSAIEVVADVEMSEKEICLNGITIDAAEPVAPDARIGMAN